MSRKYTDKEKADYWKAKAQQAVVVTRAPVTARAPKRAPVAKKPMKVAVKKSSSRSSTSKQMQPEGSFGQRVGSTLGGMIGHGIQNLVTKLIGFGDYTVQENTLYCGGMLPLEIKNTTYNGGFIVRHREYLGAVFATTAFTNTVYPLNPGLSGTFPWCATVANAFEQWRMRGAVVEFVSTSSDAVLSASASSSLGSVIIATQYDGSEPVFISKAQMLNHEFANARKPSEDFIHLIECKSSLTAQQLYYTRNASVPLNSDERLYDLGLLQVATEGMQNASAGSTCGDLYITYELELYKPNVRPGAPIGSILSDHFQLNGWSGAQPLGTSSTRSASSSLGGSILGTSGYRFPASIIDGNFLVVIRWSGATGGTVTYPTFTAINCSVMNLFENNTNGSAFSPLNGQVNALTAMWAFIVNIATTSAQVAGWNFGAAGSLPAGANLFGDMIITQIDTDLVNLLSKKRRVPRHRPGRRRPLYLPGVQFPLSFDEESGTVQVHTTSAEQGDEDTDPEKDEDDESSGEYVKIKTLVNKRSSRQLTPTPK